MSRVLAWLPSLPALFPRARVPADLDAVTRIRWEAEVAPREVGVAPEARDRIWEAVRRLYRSGIHPAIAAVRAPRRRRAARPHDRSRARQRAGRCARRAEDRLLAGLAVLYVVGVEGGHGDGDPPARPAESPPPGRSGVRVHPGVRGRREALDHHPPRPGASGRYPEPAARGAASARSRRHRRRARPDRRAAAREPRRAPARLPRRHRRVRAGRGRPARHGQDHPHRAGGDDPPARSACAGSATACAATTCRRS